MLGSRLVWANMPGGVVVTHGYTGRYSPHSMQPPVTGEVLDRLWLPATAAENAFDQFTCDSQTNAVCFAANCCQALEGCLPVFE